LFQKKDYSAAQEIFLTLEHKDIWIVDLLKMLDAVATSSDAKRLIQSGAVLVDDVSVAEFKAIIHVHAGMIIKVGKHRIYKLMV